MATLTVGVFAKVPMKNATLVLCAGTLATVAQPCLAQATDSPVSSPPYTAEQLYTERHSAAVASVGTMNVVVGRLATQCRDSLGKPDAWVKEFVGSWQSRNEQYVRAATTYSANMMPYLERTQGSAAKEAAMRELTTAVRGQGAGTVADLIGAGDNQEKCARAVGIVEAGRLDVKPNFPGYEAISEVVMILQSMQAMK